MSTSSNDSLASVADKGWFFVSINTAILAFILCGLITTLVEVAGYWPETEFTDLLLPITSSESIDSEELYPELNSAVFQFLEVVKVAKFYTIHIYLSTYILLPYPVIMERQKVLLTPWLICSMLRSVLLNLLMTLAGVTLCAGRSSLHYPCLQYAALRGAEFCISLFVWTSVHNLYHLLKYKCPAEGMKRVMKTFHRAGISTSLAMSGSSHSSAILSFHSDQLDDLSMETTLVERAAMAWIAREILESREDYVTDAQFSHYLALKATTELRQIIKEIVERKREERRKQKKTTVKERVKDSLYFYNVMAKQQETGAPIGNAESFEQSEDLPHRDPISRIIPPLRPSYNIKGSLHDKPNSHNVKVSSSLKTNIAEKSVEVQTDPLSPEMVTLFDTLERAESSRTH